jgi:pyruvate,water dikinase
MGGKQFEPIEANPMIGWRGASRYYGNERARESFALECAAVRRVIEEMGMTNLQVMIPFTRTVDELHLVLAEMKRHGLERNKNIKIIMMCEIPVRRIIESGVVVSSFSHTRTHTHTVECITCR